MDEGFGRFAGATDCGCLQLVAPARHTARDTMTTSLGRKEDGASVREVALLSAGFFGGMVCMEM